MSTRRRRTANQKIDFKKAITGAMISAGTGAVAHIVGEAIDMKEPETLDYIFLAGGVVLPEVIKKEEMETVGASLTAIGAYRLAERKGLADKLGFNQAKTSGLPDDFVIGKVDEWNAEDVYTSSNKKKATSKKTTVQ